MKKAEVELLLSTVEINNKGALVIPTKCPGVGRKNDILKDKEGTPCCVVNNKRCRYLMDAKFDFDEHIKKKRRFRQTELHWAQIPRANDPSKPLQEKAVNLLSTVVHKLKKKKVVVLNQNYISRITKCEHDQNNNILKQLYNILEIQFHHKIIINGKIRRNVHTFEHTEKGRAIIEKPHALFMKKHFVGKKLVNPVILTPIEVKNNSQGYEFFRYTSIYKEEVLEKYRSNTQARESISCNNSSFVNSKETNTPAETISLVSEKECCFENADSNQQTSVIETKVGKFRPNKRRKKTNSEIKLKKAKLATELKPQKAKIIRPVFYPKPKSLSDMNSLLDQEIYDDLRSGSGRDFSNNFIAQRLLAMSKKRSLANHNFKTRKGFVSYMSLVLEHELYDAVKTCNIDFKLKANITEIDRIAQEQERFLAGIENSTCITLEWQFKKKLVSVLSPCKAYKLLQSYISLEIKNNVLRIQLTQPVELSELEKEVILNQAKAVYENTSGDDIVFIQDLEFIVTENNTPRTRASNITASKDKQEDSFPKGIWGDIVKKLIDEYGVHVYKNWFSKLTANVDEVASTIELKCPSQFVVNWISSNYEDSLRAVVAGFGMKFKGII